jgi:hypothetical protein
MPSQRSSGTGETRAAVIRVRAPSGKLKTLTADAVEISGPFVNATGHWRDDPSCRRGTFTWPAHELVEVRWVA